ncbi:MAG: hypothetical protein AAGK00_20330 [Pseudomonadota bacterium]
MSTGLAIAGRALLFSAIVAVGMGTALAARPGKPVVALFAPGTDLSQSVAAADAAGLNIVSYGNTPWILALEGPTAEARGILRDAGAVVLLDYARAAFLCTRPPRR